MSQALSNLTVEQKNIISLVYGFNGDKPLSINKICKEKNISRAQCMKIINSSLISLKENIKL
jgi:DNA-directed RNA polymerase sigma subunit (sigma70/sigma32)